MSPRLSISPDDALLHGKSDTGEWDGAKFTKVRRGRPVALTIALPVPPTTNKLWAPVRTKHGAKMVARAEYREWKAVAKREVEAQRAGASIPWMFRASILMPAGPYDADNLIKATLDACQAGGAVVNDKFCLGGSWDVDDTRAGTVLVELTPIPPPVCAPQRKRATARKEPIS